MSYIQGKQLKKRSAKADLDLSSDGSVWKTPWNGDPDVLQYTYSHASAREHSRMVGWDIPDFHRRLKSGELLPHTPWRQYSTEGNTSGVYDISTDSTGTGNYIGRVYATASFCQFQNWMIVEDDLKALAPITYDKYVAEAAAKIYSSGHDSLTFLAELADVRRLFVHAAKTLLKMRLPTSWKAMSSEWLAGRYGWRTLIYDFRELNEAIKSLTDEEKRTRYSEKAGTTWSESSVDVTYEERAHYTLDLTVQDKVTYHLRGSVTADILIPTFQFNPLVTAWEKIPFSFVIDWFVNIGKAIAANAFLNLQTAYAGSAGYCIELERSFNCEIGTEQSTFMSGQHTQTGNSKAWLEVRTPSRVPKTPHFTLRLNPYKIVDLIGLIVQRI